MREVESRHEGLHTYRWQMGGRENFLVAGRHAPQQLQLREVSEDGLSRGDRSLRGVHAPLFPIKMPEYFSREPFCFREGAFVVSICLPGTILTGFFGKKIVPTGVWEVNSASLLIHDARIAQSKSCGIPSPIRRPSAVIF